MRIISIEIFSWFISMVAVYWALPRSWQLNWISLLTVVFLSVYAPFSLLALIFVMLVCYFLGNNRTGLAIIVCIGLLIGYRILSSGNPMQAVSFRSDDLQPAQFFILLGFSYYILRALHYLLERFKGNCPEHTLLQFFNYLFFLPTFFVGPINRFDDFVRDARRRRWDSSLFSIGMTRIVYGLFKIIFIAYFLINRKMGFWIEDLDQSNLSLLQYLDCWQYGLNLYFQFSGYCDIAIGIGALLGFRINENFNYPFLKPNISEFWRSWHMSLTGWSRKYIYPSVAATTRSPYLAIFVSMLFVGIWHELSVKYFLWGLYHGVGIMIHRYYQRVLSGYDRFENRFIKSSMWLINVFVTLHFVIIGFVLNKESSLADSWLALQQLLGI
jgi:alginate O-acetyltransferase complex protein AlgI